MAPVKFIVFFVFFASSVVSTVSYGAQIVCDTDVSNTQSRLVFKSTDDVYDFSKIDLPSGFRLAGQYLAKLNKLKLYVYDYSKDRHVLLNAQEFDVNPRSCEQDFGKNRVYGEPYERELSFQCHQDCN